MMSSEKVTVEKKLWLVAFDDSAIARHALRTAIELANSGGDDVVAVSIVPTFTKAADSLEAKTKMEQAIKEFQRLSPLSKISIRIETTNDDPAEVFLNVAAELKADVAVFGKRNLSGWEKLVSSSFSSAVLQKTTIPIVVVPEPEPTQ
mmetsp:Transcript_3264/g.4784  ORF Transcript_3264/g.4784 Transcript_3264/m.4784 type:complete len:148 (+) Transcript_3264:25-468(+)